MSSPQRGETWLVDLNPTRGQEIQKTRPVIVISSNAFQAIAMRIVIPITSWQEKFNTRPFMVSIAPTPENGLDRRSAGNILQVRSISTERFVKQLGHLEDEQLQEMIAGLAICVEFEIS